MSDSALSYTFATWVALLHHAGVPAADEAIASLCARLKGADLDTAKALGAELVAALAGVEADPAAEAARLYGARLVAEVPGDDRAERLAGLRRHGFQHQTPLLVWLWERHGDGEVRPHWVLVDHLADGVHVLDPNPWDDVEEDRVLDVHDFLVLWELGGCRVLAARKA